MGRSLFNGFLRQLSNNNEAEKKQPCYLLSTTQTLTIGRDPQHCQIVLDSSSYGAVSRRHAEVHPLSGSASEGGSPVWQLCDLSSANGTYINGKRIQGCRILQADDRIMLGQNGPEFIFECRPVRPPMTPLPSIEAPASLSPAQVSVTVPPPATPRVLPQPRPNSVTLTQLFPIFSTGRDLTQKAYLVPSIITIGFVVLLFAAVGEPVVFNLLLSAYLAGAAYYFVYRLCGKRKPWWVLLGTALTTILILVSPLLKIFIFVFRDILPGAVPIEGEQINFLSLLIRMFFGAGLMEELIKAIPVLGAYLLGRSLRSHWRHQIGVWEPLDGILLGTASAVGFTLLETLGQYIPDIVQNVTLQAGEGAGELVGLQLLIPRVLGSVAGHMAYSGYLGYFIGLSVLMPHNRWRILGVGYLSAAGLHALWNSTGIFSGVSLAVVGVLSYAFLAAAILKARSLSPTRSQNFATRFFGPPDS